MLGDAQGVFSDNFSTAGADGNFTNVAGTWTAAGGTYGVSSNVQPYDFSLLTTAGDTNYANFTLSYDVTSSYDGGVMFHSDIAANNGIAFIVRPDNNDAYFVTRTGGSFQGPGGTISLGGQAAGSGLHVVVTGRGNNYSATISTLATGSVIGTVNVNDANGNNQVFAAYTTGYVGFYSFGSGAGIDRYDHFAVAVPEPSTWALAGVGALGAGVVALRRRRALA